jgi:hypothetical protein
MRVVVLRCEGRQQPPGYPCIALIIKELVKPKAFPCRTADHSLGPRGFFGNPWTSCRPQIRGPALSAESRKDVLQKRKAPGQRDQKDVLGKRGPLSGAAPLLLHALLCLESKHRGVFCEVYATLVARAAVVLNVAAGGTGKAERGVAVRAELCLLGILMTAFGASHREAVSAV